MMARANVIAAIAAAIAPISHAQKFDVLVNGGKSVTFNSEASAGMVEVSLFLDTEGSAESFFGEFFAWAIFGGTFNATGGSFLSFTEDPTERTGTNPFAEDGPDTWTLGRRPVGSDAANGGFRYPSPLTNSYTYEGGSTLTRPGGIRGGIFEGFQGPSSLGNVATETSERIEVFRALIDFSDVTAGSYEVNFDAFSADIEIDAGPDVYATRSVLSLMSTSYSTVTIIPAPASAALLGLASLTAVRRRR